MRKYFKLSTFLVTALITACSPKIHTLHFSAPDIANIKLPVSPNLGDLKGILGCVRPESDQSQSPQAAKNAWLFEDRIESQDYITVDCDGKTINTGHGPVRTEEKHIRIPAPQDLPKGLSFIEVENSRTCSSYRVNVEDDKNLETELETPSGMVSTEVPLTRAGRSGEVDLYATDAAGPLGFIETTLLNGRNVVQIRYYGKCLGYRKDRIETLGERFNCKTAELIATYDMTITLKIERPEIPGVRSVKSCPNTH